MKQFVTLLSFISISFVASSQKVSGKLKFEQGQTFEIAIQVKNTIAQQAMGQSIDFTVDASGNHSYKVTNATEDNNTLKHQVNRILFAFDGMGQKLKFDSNIEKDLNGSFGKPIKDLLGKKYDMIVDPGGKTLMTLPEKIQLTEGDSRLAIITTMLKDVLDIVQPPQKGKGSFFKVLPETETGKGETWTESSLSENGKFDATYTISDINDSTIVVDFTSTSLTISKSEMMGNEMTTRMTNKSTGKIIIDKATGIIKEKAITTDSNGNSESSFGTMPVTSKTTTTITVKPVM
jgi:Family of unknown function (DUF6263)